MKREKRRAANRRSALKSRYREMVMLEELQRNTSELSVQNATLRQDNESLRSLVTTIRKAQSEAQQAAQIVSCPFSSWADHFHLKPSDSHLLYLLISFPSQKSLLMLGGGNTNTFQQASPYPGISYQQLLNVMSAVAPTHRTPATQAAALVQRLQLPSDQRRPAFM